MSKNQFEPSTAEVHRNAIGNADLDDALIGQALSIFQGLRQSRVTDNAAPLASGDQTLPSVVRNQRNLVSGLLSGPCDQAQTVRNSGIYDLLGGSNDQLPAVRRTDKGNSAVISNTGDLIRGITSRPLQGATETLRNDKCDRAIIPNTEIHGRGRPNGEQSSIGRGVQSLFENLETNALPRHLETNPRGMFQCTAEVPNTIKDALRHLQNELRGPDNIILCAYRLPPEGNPSIREWRKPNGPSDVVLCAAKTPITGQRPSPDNYYACVYYYPLIIKDGMIQRQSD